MAARRGHRCAQHSRRHRRVATVTRERRIDLAVLLLLRSHEPAATDCRGPGISARLDLPAAAAGKPRFRRRRDDLPRHPGTLARGVRALIANRCGVGGDRRSCRDARIYRGHRAIAISPLAFFPTAAEKSARAAHVLAKSGEFRTARTLPWISILMN